VWKNPEHGSAATVADSPVPAAAVSFPAEISQPLRIVAVRVRDPRPFGMSDFRLAQMIWKFQTAKRRYGKVQDNLTETLFGVIRCLSTAIDAKDAYTCGHSERVARIAVRLGKEMGFSSGEISDLYLAGLLHDVGKIGIRDEVLLKQDKLMPEEFRHIQEHVLIGERIVGSIPRLAYLRPGVRSHHERIDGNGYPDGLVGDEIPLIARVLTVADCCDAMVSGRRYRPGLSQAKVEEIFAEGAGSQWDPDILKCFFSCRSEVYDVYQRGLGQSVYMAVERAAGADCDDNSRSNSFNDFLTSAPLSAWPRQPAPR